MQEFDLIVVGGGPAGYIGAVQAARLGVSVAVVEEINVGGVCLNRGCIPTKTLVDTAKTFDLVNAAKRRGITVPGQLGIDLKTAVQYKQRLIKKLGMGIEILLRDSGVSLIKGTATVQPDLTVDVTGHDSLCAKKIIIATGTVPMRLPIPGIDDQRVLTSDDMLALEFVPPNLVVLGGGIIGVETSRIFNSFGAKVQMIEALDRICPFLDEEISTALTKSLTAAKIKVAVSAKLERIEPLDDKLVLHIADGSTIEASHLLVAIGRTTDLRAVASLDLAMHKNYIAVDDNMQTSHPDIYAAGDINGRCMLAHAAYRMGEIAASHAVSMLRHDSTIPVRPLNTEHVPGGIFSDPEIGYVGLTETEARKRLGNILVGRFPLAANGRAVASGHPDGFVKVIADTKTERIIGVHIFGMYASELINEAVTVVQNGLTIKQWSHVIHAHPSISEALPEAAAQSIGEALHLPKNPIAQR